MNTSPIHRMMGRLITVNKWFIVFVFAGVVYADDPRAQFDRLKSEAQAAVSAQDWTAAESRYRQLLSAAERVHLSLSEMYADVVSPLAEVYKRTDSTEKLEQLYQDRLEHAGEGLARGLAQADLGFLYQSGDFPSADRFHGERLVEAAIHSFESCAVEEQCRRRLADTEGIQGAMFFQNLDYRRAEPLFRSVIQMPESTVQDEVMLVSLHALCGILVLQKNFDEARQLELRSAAFEASHPGALARLKGEGSKSRSR